MRVGAALVVARGFDETVLPEYFFQRERVGILVFRRIPRGGMKVKFKHRHLFLVSSPHRAHWLSPVASPYLDAEKYPFLSSS